MAAEKSSILVIDDDRMTRELLARALNRAGFSVDICPNGREALQIVELQRPALIVSDYEMPEFNGAQLCELVRTHSDPEIADLPIILLTAHSGEDHEVECLRAGANDFVSKPINGAILKARIETQLRLHALRAQLVQQNDELAEWRRNHERDLEAAQLTQQAILPTRLPQIAGWDVASLYRPVIHVGGDIYDWLRLPDGHWLFWIADATGHGASAALLTTLTKLVFRHAAGETGAEPGALLKAANQEFHSILRGKSFMTAACLVIRPESGTIGFAGAGHPPLLIKRASGEVEFLSSQAPPIGIVREMECGEVDAELSPGDTALLYTDGLYSVIRENGARLTHTDLSEFLPADAGSSEEFLSRTFQAVDAAGTGPLPDDVAVVALRRVPSA